MDDPTRLLEPIAAHFGVLALIAWAEVRIRPLLVRIVGHLRATHEKLDVDDAARARGLKAAEAEIGASK